MMRPIRTMLSRAARPAGAIAGLLAAILVIGSARAEAAAIVDARGRTIEIGSSQRIVSIGGSVTEILVALGLEDRIVAIDSTSTFPSRIKAKPGVGYMRSLSPEGVLALGPDLILAIEGSGPASALDVLTKVSVPVVMVPEAETAAQVQRKIEFVAEVVGEAEKGRQIAAMVGSDLAALEASLAEVSARRRAIFVLALGGGAPMTAGRDTAADAMFTLAHVDNALSGFHGYKTVVDESAMVAAPEAVVMMDDRGHATSAVLELPAFKGTPAARDKRLVAMGGLYLLGFGPRSAHAARDLAAAIYPEHRFAPLPDRPWTSDGPAR